MRRGLKPHSRCGDGTSTRACFQRFTVSSVLARKNWLPRLHSSTGSQLRGSIEAGLAQSSSCPFLPDGEMACLRRSLYNDGMPNEANNMQTHGTTVLCVRKDGKVVLVADGQVTMGDHVMKHTARKTRRLYDDKVLAGFAGSTADAISLFERFE